MIILLLALIYIKAAVARIISRQHHRVNLGGTLKTAGEGVTKRFFKRDYVLNFVNKVVNAKYKCLFTLTIKIGIFNEDLRISFPVTVVAVVLSVMIATITAVLPMQATMGIRPTVILHNRWKTCSRSFGVGQYKRTLQQTYSYAKACRPSHKGEELTHHRKTIQFERGRTSRCRQLCKWARFKKDRP